jgi:TRAP-type C4-dicarboxylate transport system permease large subunit
MRYNHRCGCTVIIDVSIGLITLPLGTVIDVVPGVERIKMDEVPKGSCPS